MLRPDEIASIQATVASFLPDAATLYASDGVTLVAQMQVRLVNDRSLNSMRNTSDFYALTAAAGTPLAPGQTVLHGSDWYLVAKVSVDTAYTLEEQAMCLALPYQLSVTRVTGNSATPASENGYGDDLSAGDETTTTRTIRAGISNDNRTESATDIGAMPRSVMTLYAPLGSDVQLTDEIALPDGRLATVQQRNLLDANGLSYALQLLVDGQ